MDTGTQHQLQVNVNAWIITISMITNAFSVWFLVALYAPHKQNVNNAHKTKNSKK